MYLPDQRDTPCRVLTRAGWLHGVVKVPRKAWLLDFLNRPERLIRLVDASFPGRAAVHPFFALARTAAIAIVPDLPDEPIHDPHLGPPTVPHAVSFLLQDGGQVDGTLSLARGMRVSDHLAHHVGFVHVHGCVLQMPTSGGFTEERDVPCVLVHMDQIVGVADKEAPGSQPSVGPAAAHA